MAQKYLDINGLTRYHDGLIEYMSEAVGTQGDMSVTDPTNMAYIKNVPDWVRSETKPEYNAIEVGADATGTAHTEVSNHNVSETAHEDIRSLIQEINTQIEESTWDDKYTKEELDSKDAATLASAKEYNDSAYANANAYTDQKIADLINGAPTTLDTLGEIATAMANNEDVVEALNESIGTKAKQTELDTHTGNNTIHITADERTNWNDANSKKHSHSNKTVLDNTTASFTTEEKTKLSGIASGANAYTHPSYTAKSSGLYKVTVDATGHVSATTAVAKSDITALGIPAQDTTYTLSSITGTLAVSKGGTGATDAATARTNLGITPANIGAATSGHTHTSFSSVVTFSGGVGGAEGGEICFAKPASGSSFGGNISMDVNANNVRIFGSHNSATKVFNIDFSSMTGSHTAIHTGNYKTYCTPANIGAAAASHGTHVSYGTSASALGTSSAGSATTVSRSDHVHALPALTSCTGTLTVAKGGTGATTAAAARTNLGLGAAATCSTTTSATSGSAALITSGAVYTALAGKANSSHNQAASTITAGTFGGQVVAPASTAYTTNHVRNQVFTTTDPGAGASTSYANGSIICVYE